jgi:hypothetical protein
MSTLSTYHDVLNQKRALHPDPGTESDLEVEDNEFALSPGQFLKRFIPKSSGAFSALGGLSRREKGLRTGLRARLSVDEAHLHDAATSEQATALHSADSPATTTAKFELTPTIGRPDRLSINALSEPSEAPPPEYTPSVQPPPEYTPSVQPPPAYTPGPPATELPGTAAQQDQLVVNDKDNDRYAYLKTRDRVFLIDNSESMAGRSRQEISKASSASLITNLCDADSDGIDLSFVRHDPLVFLSMRDQKSMGKTRPYSDIAKDQRAMPLQRAVDRQVFEIPSYVAHSHFTNALGDYCAKYNFMNEEYARQKGHHIDPSQTTEIGIGSGKKATSSGIVTTPFRFQDEKQAYLLNFHVLPNCIHDVILGKSFLKATRTFSAVTNFARRVKSRIVQGLRHHHLLYLGDSMPRFQGLVNGKPEFGLADSGAKVMVMDEDYARGLNLPISYDSRRKLVFADGSTANTSGMIYGVKWEFGLGLENESENVKRKEHTLDFHILKNAPANVILSDYFLFGTNAYSEYECFLVDDDDEDDEAYFFAIDYAENENTQVDRNSLSTMQHAEDMLRDREDDHIMNLTGEEEAVEKARVNARRERWHRHFQAEKQRLERAQGSAPLAATSTSSGTTIAQCSSSPSATSPNPPSPTPRKRFWMRFKLKRRKPS